MNQLLSPAHGLTCEVTARSDDLDRTICADGEKEVETEGLDRYSLYLGVTGGRLGRAVSGTMLEAALEVLRRSPRRVGILWYLRREAPDEHRTPELQAFRDHLCSDAVRCHEFASPAHLAKLLMLHLPLAIRDIRRAEESAVPAGPADTVLELAHADAAGFLALACEAMARIEEATGRWIAGMGEIHGHLEATRCGMHRAMRQQSVPRGVIRSLAWRFAGEVRALGIAADAWRTTCAQDFAVVHLSLSRTMLLAATDMGWMGRPELRDATGSLHSALRVVKDILKDPATKHAALTAVIDALAATRSVRAEMALAARQLERTTNALFDAESSVEDLLGALTWLRHDSVSAGRPPTGDPAR